MSEIVVVVEPPLPEIVVVLEQTAVAAEALTRSLADAALDARVDVLEDEAGDPRPPDGPAGGVLSGSYPDPGFAVPMATQATADLKAPLASPALTGIPTAPTAAPGTASTQIATTAFAAALVAAVINSAPGALDTLDELAAALGDDANFAATVTAALAGKMAKASNLSDLTDVVAARGNLGLGVEVPAPIFQYSGILPASRTGTARIYNDSGRALTISAIRVSLGVAGSTSTIVDVNKNGVTIFTTQGNRPTVAAAGQTVKSAAPDVTSWANGEYLTVDIDQGGTSAAGLQVQVVAA